ncbi:MAG: hypothetical protein R6V28_05145 [Nitriliruptoraceae bacterium]
MAPAIARNHSTTVRRIMIAAAGAVSSLGLLAGPSLAMQPAGEPAPERFGCVDGHDDAVGGHPGAAGLLHATPKVGELTVDTSPTAWNAVEHADPIELGGC